MQRSTTILATAALASLIIAVPHTATFAEGTTGTQATTTADNGGNAGGGDNVAPNPNPNPGDGDNSGTTTPDNPTTPTFDKAAFDQQAVKFMETFRAKLLGLINQARAEAGVPPMTASVVLTNSAQTWSNYESQNKLGGVHYDDWRFGENGGTELAGVNKYMARENVGYVSARGGHIGDAKNTADIMAQRTFDGFMKQDEGHRETLMSAKTDAIGIGVSFGEATDGLDWDGNVIHDVHDGRQGMNIVIQTGGFSSEKQVGPDKAQTEYVSGDTQTLPEAPKGQFDAALPNVTAVTDKPDPTEPTTPTEPTGPTEPTTPTEPTNPTEPTGPTEPTTPTDPTTPTEPTGPTGPVTPTEPTGPQQPSNPTPDTGIPPSAPSNSNNTTPTPVRNGVKLANTGSTTAPIMATASLFALAGAFSLTMRQKRNS